MALQIRRGSDSQRLTQTFAQGELIYTTDYKDLWIGDSVTAGGTQVAPVKSVNGLVGTVALTTDNITQGTTNKYYSSAQAKLDVGASLVAGNSGNTGITFSLNSGTGVITASVASVASIANVLADPSPALGGNLLLNSHDITGTGNINTTGNISATGNINVNSRLTITGNYVSVPLTGNSVYFSHTAIQTTADLTDQDSGITLNGITSGTRTTTGITYNVARGTLVSPTILQSNDILSNIFIQAYSGASSRYVGSAALITSVDSGSVVTNGASVPTAWGLITLNGVNSFNDVYSSGVYLKYNSNAVLTVPQINSVGLITATTSKGRLVSGVTTFTSITGTSVTAAATYNNVVAASTTGSGIGALFNVQKTGAGTAYSGVTTITVVTSGNNYATGDTITISGAVLGGATPANDLTFTIATHVGTGIGYATGAGGTVTQLTDKTTTVVLNKACGTITLAGTALSAATVVSFTITNSTISASDIL